VANPAQEADLASLLQQAGIPMDPMSGNGDTNPPADSSPPAPSQPVAAMQSNSDQVDPTTGAPLAPPDPGMPEPAQTMLGRIRQSNPDAADQSDFQVARNLYDQGLHRPNETFPAFATRMGVQMGAGETMANQALTNAALHLNQPIEAAASGVGGLFSGQGFGDAFGQKMRELRDQEQVGAYQHPNASGLGDMAGTAASFAGPVGKLVETGASKVPGLAAVTKTPLGASATKMAGINVAGDTIPNATDAANHPDGFSWQDFLADEGGDAVKGVAAAAAGQAITKGLTAFGAPLMRSIAGGFDAAENALRGLPRTLYAKGAAKMSQGFQGAGDDPLAAALKRDQEYYGGSGGVLDKSSINVSKGVSDLTDLADQPGYAQKLGPMLDDAFAKNAPPPPPSPINIHLPDPQLQKLFGDVNLDEGPDNLRTPTVERRDFGGLGDGDTDTLPPPRQLPPDLGRTPPGGPPKPPIGGGPDFSDFDSDPSNPDIAGTLQQHLAALRQADPTGQSAQRYIADIYKQLIPQRLAGSFDPEAAFTKGANTGKLIQPPVTGLGKIGQGWYERTGGGPGRVMFPLINQPRSAVGGAASVVGNLTGLGAKVPLVQGLKAGAGLADFVGAPGDYLANKLPTSMGNAVKPVLNSMPGLWQNYLNTELGNRGAQANPLDTMFPDVYHAPAPVAQPPANAQHSELMQWLGTTDRPTAVAYIGSRLGPQVQQQMANAGDNWKAALFNLASDPKSRAALMPPDETAEG
jgi:hypothetical protein